MAIPPGNFKPGLGPPMDWYGDVAPEVKSKIRLGYTS
jgi:hypothetical protein